MITEFRESSICFGGAAPNTFVFYPVIWNILLVIITDIAQAIQMPIATCMSVMSRSSTNSLIAIWCIAAAIYGRKFGYKLQL